MSMDTCHLCSKYVDTDEDPGCYVDLDDENLKSVIRCVCEACREKYGLDDEEGPF